jgi:hypothetical protein
MGNPLSGIMADIALDAIISQAVEKLEEMGIRLTFLKKYVDDLCVAANVNNIDTILTIFNQIHPNIIFTIEKEQNQCISFLDLTLIRYGTNVTTQWFNKPTSSNRILNFLSSHPKNMKINTARSFAIRVLNLSHKRFYMENCETIFKILEKNNYPPNLISKITKQATYIVKQKHTQHSINNTTRTQQNIQSATNIVSQNNTTNQADNNTSPQEQKIYKSITYVPGLTENLKKRINKAKITVKRGKHRGKKVELAFKPKNQVKQHYTKLKDDYKKDEKSSVIYKVDCMKCSKSYIGQTSRKLRERMNDHKGYVKKKTEESALASHTLKNKDHIFDFDNIRIIGTETNRSKRETKETINIFKNKQNIVNKRQDIEGFQKIYRRLIINTM